MFFLPLSTVGEGQGWLTAAGRGPLGLGSDIVRMMCVFRAALLGTSWASVWDLAEDECERLSLDPLPACV